MLVRGDWIGGEFEILELLGRGGMGEVYLARQPRLDCFRAVKVLLSDRVWDPEARARFEREARFTGRILSEHVVEMVRCGFDQTRQLPWLVMEYLEGENLRRAVARFGVPAHQPCLEVLRQVFHAVAAAHAANITHRDLKPENLFVARSRRADAPFTIKLLDFGIAWGGAPGAHTAPLGTPAWSAPEQRRGEAIGPATDVWALGLLVFWLLCGESYFRAEADVLTVSASARAQELGRPALSAAFDLWFSRCLAAQPQQRFKNATACWRALLELWPSLGPFTGGASWDNVDAQLVVRVPEELSTHQAAAQVAAPPRRRNNIFNLPQRARSFVGRSNELQWLRNELFRGDVRVCAGVEGLPGIGKTELALQLAHHLAQEELFPGGIYWFAAEHQDLTRAWASEEIAGVLGVSAVGVQERAQAALRIVSSSPAAVLVILDNVEAWTELEHPQPLPTGIHVSLLITTRGHRVGGSRFHSLTLGFLPRADARRLLETTAGAAVAERPGFEQLLTHLAGYTLAVELAGAYLAEYPELTPEAYLERLRQGEPEEQVAEFTRYERTVQQTFRELWLRLPTALCDAWLLAAQFAPEPVSVKLSDAVGLRVQARADLRRLHLIECDAQGNWRMHRLVRAFALSAVPASHQTQLAEAFLAGVHQHMLGLELSTGYRIYGPDRAHLDLAVQLAWQRPYSEAMGEMVASIASGLHSLGELERAKQHFEWALAGDRSVLGEEHSKVATLRSNLSLVLQELGEFEPAREHLQRALESDLRGRPDDAYKILLRRSNLARLLLECGDPIEARDLLTSAIAVALPVLGEPHGMIAIARSNLAAILCELGELESAHQTILLSLESDRARYDDQHPLVAVRRARLGMILAAQSEWVGAERELREALRIELASVGSEHPRAALLRAHISVLLQRRGEHDAAEAEASEALRVVSRQRPGSTYRRSVEKLLTVQAVG